MRPYYILDIQKFDKNINEYSTPSQVGIAGVKDRSASITFKKQKNQMIDSFIKYDLSWEKLLNQKGRAYGIERIFEQFILIEEKVLYYNSDKNIVILSISKEIFNSFAKNFCNEKRNSEIIFKKINVDFDRIITHQSSLGIEGVWLGNYADVNIDSLYLLGNQIENSTKYKQFRESGAEIKNLTIVYNFNHKREKIMITKEGGIILYRPLDETDMLKLMVNIYENLLSY